MFRKKQKISVFILVLILMTSMAAQPLYAATIDSGTMALPPTVEPQWQHVQSVGLFLDFSYPKSIYVSVDISAYKGTSFPKVIVTVEDITGGKIEQLDQWSSLYSNGPCFMFGCQSAEPVKGRTYRLTVEAHALRNGIEEVIIQHKDRTY